MGAAAVEGDGDVRREPCGELVGAARHRVGLVDHAGQSGHACADDDGGARIAAHADGHPGILGAQNAAALGPGADQGRGQQVALGPEGRVEGDHVDGVQAESGARNQFGLQAPLGADEGDHRVRVGPAQRFGEREPGVDVAAGAARTDHDGEWCAHGGHTRGAV